MTLITTSVLTAESSLTNLLFDMALANAELDNSNIKYVDVFPSCNFESIRDVKFRIPCKINVTLKIYTAVYFNYVRHIHFNRSTYFKFVKTYHLN